jgi:CHASE2 domain-containing sensor protein
MPWLPPINPQQTSTLRYYLQDYDKETANRETILTVFSAKTSVSAAALKDNIVVIGGSYSDGRDMHSTPLGSMPGALIIINAIHSLLQHGEIKPSPIWLKLLLTAIAIILVSILFMYLSSFWSVIFTGTTIIILLIPLSIWQLGHGVWIDFALPLLGVQLHQIATDFHNMAEKLEK